MKRRKETDKLDEGKERIRDEIAEKMDGEKYAVNTHYKAMHVYLLGIKNVNRNSSSLDWNYFPST